MHGLIIRSFEGFLRNTYGAELWEMAVNELDLGFDRFEPMFHYDDEVAADLTAIAARRLCRSREALLEDFGTYLVAHPASERVRRLLRFGGVDYEDFLTSLEDLAGRVRLAVPDLVLPRVSLSDRGGGEFLLTLTGDIIGAGSVYLGLLRALADDYGALVIADTESQRDGEARISIRLLEADFAEGRGFALTAVDGAAVGEAIG